MKRLFLYQVYHYNKKLFYGFCLFAALSIVCNITGFEITPFYVWGMYSQKEKPTRHYSIYCITTGQDTVDYSTGYLPASRFFLLSPLTYFSGMDNNNDPMADFLAQKLKGGRALLLPLVPRVSNSAQAIESFPAWYKRYLSQITGREVKALKIDVLKTSYAPHSIEVDSQYNVLNEK